MAREVVTIPPRLLGLMRFDWRIDWRGKRSPGGVQTVISRMPLWRGAPQVFLHRAAIAEWRARLAQVEGLVGVLRVEMADVLGFPAREIRRDLWESGVPFDGDVTFENGPGFAWQPFVTVTAAVSAGAPSVEVEADPALPAPVAGQIMSYRDWPFMVTAAEDMGSARWRLTVKRLAVDLPAGALVDLRASGLFELVSNDAGNPGFDHKLIATPTIELQEALVR